MMLHNTGSWSAGYFVLEEAASAWWYATLDPDQQQTSYHRNRIGMKSYNIGAWSQKTLYKESRIHMIVYNTGFLSAGDVILEELDQHDVL